MPRGREPEGEIALTNAERQARYRARRLVEQPPVIVRQSRPSRQSRGKRWDNALAVMMTVQAECAAWFEALPESLRDSATAEVRWTPETGQVAKRESSLGAAGWPKVRHDQYTEETRA